MPNQHRPLRQPASVHTWLLGNGRRLPRLSHHLTHRLVRSSSPARSAVRFSASTSGCRAAHARVHACCWRRGEPHALRKMEAFPQHATDRPALTTGHEATIEEKRVPAKVCTISGARRGARRGSLDAALAAPA